MTEIRLSFLDRKGQVGHIKATVDAYEKWTSMLEVAAKEFGGAKAAIKAAPKDADAIKKFDRAGDKLLSLLEARHQCEASLLSARRLFRIYD